MEKLHGKQHLRSVTENVVRYAGVLQGCVTLLGDIMCNGGASRRVTLVRYGALQCVTMVRYEGALRC